MTNEKPDYRRETKKRKISFEFVFLKYTHKIICEKRQIRNEKNSSLIFLYYIFLVLTFLTFGFILWVKRVQSVKDSENGVDTESTENLKMMNEISNGDKSEKKNVNVKFKNFLDDNTICQSNTERYENLVKITDNYIERFVNLFLITANLVNYEIKDLSKMITIDLEISVSGEDLAYLQNYSKNKKNSSYPRNFSKLDAIFSKIARLKERSFMENAFKSSRSFFAGINIFSAFNRSDFSHFFPLLVIFFVTRAMHHYIFHRSFYVFLGVFINSLIFWESIQLYWKKIKETDIEIYVKTLQSKGLPEDCDPANIRWYHSMLNLFFESKCLQYHKNINKNAVEEISLFKCIIDTYSFYLIQTPVRIFGASIRDFTGELSALWPWPFKYLINIPIAFFCMIMVLLFVFVFCGKRLRLAFFGTALEIGDVKVGTEIEKSTITGCEIPKATRTIRKQKLLTKNKFPRRFEIDLERRKKLYLKVSRSLPYMTAKNRPNFSCSDTSLNDSEIKYDSF